MLNEPGLLKKYLVVVDTNHVYLTNCLWLVRSNEMFNTGPAPRPQFNSFLLGFLIILWLVCYTSESKGLHKKRDKIYTNGWAVKVRGGFGNAKIVAKRHGFAKVEKVWLQSSSLHFIIALKLRKRLLKRYLS
jgi:hypothetical protein